MASAVNSLFGSDASSASGAGATKKATSEQMFLQLLVAQLKNQNPLNPQDGTQFVSQLAQFSQLEQVIAIRKDIESPQTSAASDASKQGSNTNSASS